jgi:hypothetical protein
MLACIALLAIALPAAGITALEILKLNESSRFFGHLGWTQECEERGRPLWWSV